MPKTSHAELAAKLLRDAAGYFRLIGGDNPALQEQMNSNADVYDQVADLLERDPQGVIELQDEPGSG